jgi:hypothetical protein
MIWRNWFYIWHNFPTWTIPLVVAIIKMVDQREGKFWLSVHQGVVQPHIDAFAVTLLRSIVIGGDYLTAHCVTARDTSTRLFWDAMGKLCHFESSDRVVWGIGRLACAAWKCKCICAHHYSTPECMHALECSAISLDNQGRRLLVYRAARLL